MLPEAQGKTTLLYVSLDLHRVGVYAYDTGKRVGTLTGFDDPYGGCVDGKETPSSTLTAARNG